MEMEADRAGDCRCKAPALPSAESVHARFAVLMLAARAGEPPLALPHLYLIFPALIYMRL